METRIDGNIVAYHFQPLHLLFCKRGCSCTTDTSLVGITLEDPFLVACFYHICKGVYLWYLSPLILDNLDDVNQFLQNSFLAGHICVCREYQATIEHIVVTLHLVVKLMYHGFGDVAVAIVLMIHDVESRYLVFICLDKLFQGLTNLSFGLRHVGFKTSVCQMIQCGINSLVI